MKVFLVIIALVIVQNMASADNSNTSTDVKACIEQTLKENATSGEYEIDESEALEYCLNK
jgi:hypothetical protein